MSDGSQESRRGVGIETGGDKERVVDDREALSDAIAARVNGLLGCAHLLPFFRPPFTMHELVLAREPQLAKNEAFLAEGRAAQLAADWRDDHPWIPPDTARPGVERHTGKPAALRAIEPVGQLHLPGFSEVESPAEDAALREAITAAAEHRQTPFPMSDDSVLVFDHVTQTHVAWASWDQWVAGFRAFRSEYLPMSQEVAPPQEIPQAVLLRLCLQSGLFLVSHLPYGLQFDRDRMMGLAEQVLTKGADDRYFQRFLQVVIISMPDDSVLYYDPAIGWASSAAADDFLIMLLAGFAPEKLSRRLRKALAY